ncbi:MAG: carbohydrate kinase family protein, partial [Gemmatimonadaceae bacterium]
VGRDWQGDSLVAILQNAGVETSAVERAEAPTNSTVCVVNSTGERLFLHRLGASSNMSAKNLNFTTEAALYSHFHMANFFTLPDIRKHARDILAGARAAGKTTSLDTGWDGMGRWMEDVGPCLPYVDLMFVNEVEAGILTGFDDAKAAAAKLRDLGAGEVIVKLGGAGSVLFSDDGTYHATPFSVTALDTTGAGDCFAGGFLAALHHRMSYPDALRFANAVGALNVQKLGAVTGILSYEETVSWMDAALHLN